MRSLMYGEKKIQRKGTVQTYFDWQTAETQKTVRSKAFMSLSLYPAILSDTVMTSLPVVNLPNIWLCNGDILGTW